MAFKLKSGNASSFKNLGSSPAKHKSDETHFHDKEGKVDYRGYDKADLFLRGKTKDKEGNIKDIKWAPAPKKLKYKKREPVLKKVQKLQQQDGFLKKNITNLMFLQEKAVKLDTFLKLLMK